MTLAPHDAIATAQATTAVVLLTDQIRAGHPNHETMDGAIGIRSGNGKRMEGMIVVVIGVIAGCIEARVEEIGTDPMVRRRGILREPRIGKGMTMMSRKRCVLLLCIRRVTAHRTGCRVLIIHL